MTLLNVLFMLLNFPQCDIGSFIFALTKIDLNFLSSSMEYYRVVTVFFSIFKRVGFNLVQNWNEILSQRSHIPFILKRIKETKLMSLMCFALLNCYNERAYMMYHFYGVWAHSLSWTNSWKTHGTEESSHGVWPINVTIHCTQVIVQLFAATLVDNQLGMPMHSS